MPADGHNDGGSDIVRRLRGGRFAQPSQSSGVTSEPNDIPAFLASPPEVLRTRPRVSLVAAEFAEAFAQKWRGWSDLLAGSFLRPSIRPPTRMEMELFARPALVLLLLPLAIASSPIVEPQSVRHEPSIILADDRLDFGKGLRQRLVSVPIAYLSENADALTDVKPEAPMPPAEDPVKPNISSESAPPDAYRIPAIVMDDRRWRLPFHSQEYVLADLPSSPHAAFKTEVDASRFPDEIESVAVQSDIPAITPRARAKRSTERRERVLGYARRVPRSKRMRPPVVEQVVVEQQDPGALPPLLFFLGAASAAESPPEPPEPRPANRPWLQDSFQNLFRYQD